MSDLKRPSRVVADAIDDLIIVRIKHADALRLGVVDMRELDYEVEVVLDALTKIIRQNGMVYE